MGQSPKKHNPTVHVVCTDQLGILIQAFPWVLKCVRWYWSMGGNMVPALTVTVRENCQYYTVSKVQVETKANLCEVVIKPCEVAASQKECQGNPVDPLIMPYCTPYTT